MSQAALNRRFITFVFGVVMLLPTDVAARSADNIFLQQRPNTSDTVRRAPTRIQDMIRAAPQLPTMPHVVDSTESAAHTALARAQIRLDTVIYAQVAGVKPGVVVRQLPKPGATVSPRVRTLIVVALAPAPPPQFVVPNLIGMTEAEAMAVLANTRLRLGQVERVESSEPEGRIFFQNPQPGPGQLSMRTFAVAVRVAVPETVIMPDLTGETTSQADRTLARHRLEVAGIQRERVDEGVASDGTVFRQSPEPGIRVPVGAPVVITLAVAPPLPLPPPPVVIVTPPLTRPVTPSVMTPTVPPVTPPVIPPVIPPDIPPVTPPPAPAITPPAAQRVSAPTVGMQAPVPPPDTPVLVRVPDVRGFTREEARQRLAGVRLALGSLELDTVPPGPATIAGVVTAQDPLQGAFALQDTPVNVRLTFVLAPAVRDAVPTWLLVVTGMLALVALAALIRAMRREQRRRAERIAGVLVSARASPHTDSVRAVLKSDPAKSLALRIAPGHTMAVGSLKNGTELVVTEGDSRG